MTRRINKWQTALAAFLAERRKMPFAWGTQDCCMFAADCNRVITGVDPVPDYRGKYNSEFGAARVLVEVGGVAGIAASRAGPEIDPRAMQVGDLVLVSLDGRETLSVCVGQHMVGPGKDGLVTIQKSLALRAWRCTKE